MSLYGDKDIQKCSNIYTSIVYPAIDVFLFGSFLCMFPFV